MSRANVGIVTLPGQFNYGNRLQCYAVSRIYAGYGLSSEELSVKQRFRVKRTVARIARKALHRQRIDPACMMSEKRKSAFVRFGSRIQSRTVARLDSCLTSEYDLFSVGSDQVWNPSQYAYNEDWFFLRFANPGQRIALAPSLGVETVTRRQAYQIARGVRGFQMLSARESRGAEIIRECSGKDAEVICDPTLVLTSEEWRSVSDSRLTPGRHYVLTYLLGGFGPDSKEILDNVTHFGNVPVIPLSDRQKPGEPDAGPAEFISLIDNAAHVVTDSFHAAVFSCILQTPLTIVRRQGGSNMFSRLETLAQTLGIEHKVCGAPEFDFLRAADYEGVPEAIERERERFRGYLEGCLDSQLPGWRSGADA